MAKDQAIEPQFNFIGGLNTEASALNFPENASLDEVNFDLKRNGTREKRLGIDKKSADTYSSAIYKSPDDIAMQSYLWENIGASSTEVIHIIQVGRYLHCYVRDMSSSTTITVAGPTATVDLADYAVISDVELYKVRFSEGKGRLFVVGKAINPFFLFFDISNAGVTEVPGFINETAYVEIDSSTSNIDTGLQWDEVNRRAYCSYIQGTTSYLKYYDADTGTVSSVSFDQTSPSTRNWMIVYSNGGTGDSNDRILYYASGNINIINTADFSYTSYPTSSLHECFKETDDYIMFITGGTTLEAWAKSATNWIGLAISEPAGYSTPYTIGTDKVSTKGVVVCKKNSDGQLAAYSIDPSGGGSPDTPNDWGAGTIGFTDVGNTVYDSTTATYWTLYNDGSQDWQLVNHQLNGTLISTTDLGINGAISAAVQHLVGDIMTYHEGTHSIYFGNKASNNIYIYIINEDRVVTINTPSMLDNIGFNNRDGKIYSLDEDHDSKTQLVIHTIDSEQQVAATPITIQVRDFEGVEDGYEIETRPSSLTGLHEYNLRNQGWPLEAECTQRPGESGPENNWSGHPTYGKYPVYFTFNEEGFYPSNADQFTLGRDGNVTQPFRVDQFSVPALRKNVFGNTQAPKGHFIYNAFNIDRSNGKTVISSVPASANRTTNERPDAVAFYAGRVFYSGVNDLEYNDKVYFSQILESMNFVGKCYQEADPTSEHITDLVDTDGGVIKITGAKQIVLLREVGESLIVGATNGIWQIKGPGGEGFKATEFQVSKLSSVGIRNPDAAVDAEGTFMYWSEGGIYAVVPDEISGELSAQNISIDRIQTFYNDISAEGKNDAQGYYDSQNKKVLWLYKDSAEDFYLYNKILFLDVTLNAFYPYEIESSSTLPRVLGVDNLISGTSTGDTFNVIDGDGDTVTAASEANDVIISTEGIIKDIVRSTHYLVVWPDGSDWDYTYADFTDTNFKDWATLGTDHYYDAYVETGYKVANDAVRKKQVTYIGVVCERTETNWSFADDSEDYINPSSCQMTSMWDYYENTASNKWSAAQQVYRFRRYVAPDSGATFANFYPDYITTKNKLRGIGKSLRLKFASEDGKDLKILGWQIFYSGTTNP